MWRRLVRWFAAGLLVLACGLPVVRADEMKVDRINTRDAAADSDSEGGGRPPALQYLVAVAFTLSVLVIVCMPSRKS